MEIQFFNEIIAPCGINCGTCIAYRREKKNRCHGCRQADLNIPKTRLACKIRNCEHLQKTESNLCFECHLLPCARLKHIDKRYRIRYKTSLILNLDTIVSRPEDIKELFRRTLEISGDYGRLKESDHLQHPSGRVGKPYDIARACLYLTEDGNDFINGTYIIIDGGMTRKMIYEP